MNNYNQKDIEYLKKYLPSNQLENGLEKLYQGIPVQYIVGNVDFYGNIINVDSRVLIPRFETELLVEKTIKYIKKYFENISNLSILDIGTGSGCIAISLKKILNCDISAIDISNDALDVAKLNAINNGVNINFMYSDIFSNIEGKFDVIISNPPYISKNEEIEEIVKNNEPNIALYADDNGLYFYDNILKNCFEYLNDKFLICFEIGHLQANEIINLVRCYLGNVDVFVEKDYSNRNRFIFIVKK